MIMGHLIHNSSALRSCLLTCYSWYMAAAPQLHHNFTIYASQRDSRWLRYIRHKHTLGLLPLVNTVSIKLGGFSPKTFRRDTLGRFLTLTNVQNLKIDRLDIPSFIPRIREHFGPFLPTLRSLDLFEPTGSNHQIVFFVGLFQHLQNLSLSLDYPTFHKSEPEGLELIPPFSPPLRGRLRVNHWIKTNLFQHMVHQFGGIRFSAMTLYEANETRLLLRACAKTLRVLRFSLSDPLGEQFYPEHAQPQANNLVAKSALLHFDLSWNKSLCKLELPVISVDTAFQDGSHDTASRFLKRVLSTIQSPIFSQVELIYQEHSFYPGHTVNYSPFGSVLREDTLCYRSRFKVLREARKVRNFQLVLLVYYQERRSRDVWRMLKEDLAAEKARGGFDDLFPEPSVTFTLTWFELSSMYL